MRFSLNASELPRTCACHAIDALAEGSAMETALWADLDDRSDLFGPLIGGAVSPSFLAVEEHTWNHQRTLGKGDTRLHMT